MQANKDELKAAVDAYESMPARMGEEAMKDCTRFCNTHARVLSKAASEYLSLLDDIQELVEARNKATQGDDWYVSRWNVYVPLESGKYRVMAEVKWHENNAHFITTAANIISKWRV